MICGGWAWRVMVCMMCVVWGVMCQCGLGLMGAMLFMMDMLWVLFMQGTLKTVRIYMRFLITAGSRWWCDV